MSRNTAHHYACDCREHRLAVLNKAALDAATALDWMKNTQGLAVVVVEEAAAIVERIYAAAEALGVVIESTDETARLERMTQEEICATT